MVKWKDLTQLQKRRYLEKSRSLIFPLTCLILILSFRSDLHDFAISTGIRLHSVYLFSLAGSLVWIVYTVIQLIADIFYAPTAQENNVEHQQAISPSQTVEQYKQALETDRHLTKLNWQIASIFLAGILTGLGLTLPQIFSPTWTSKASSGYPAVIVSALGLVTLCSWFLFVRRNRDFSNIALTAARKLETDYGQLNIMRMVERDGMVLIDGKELRISGPNGYTLVRMIVLTFMIVLSGVIVLSLRK